MQRFILAALATLSLSLSLAATAEASVAGVHAEILRGKDVKIVLADVLSDKDVPGVCCQQ